MPIYTLSSLGEKGAQLRLACDGDGCQSGFIMAPGKTREQLIDRAKEHGFVVTGSPDSQKFLCPACANVSAAS